ncbi:MAG: hypothetical protein BGO43_04585 [Gammaproteobacteria bacterium 39-13]|nr:hypothetical protein [Gammaproteobacteria bacterium]OJV94950.1 MAG: hypothetical protein BGO43_04585 [Gammaproteobacteria bacterium 39-13]
MSKRLQMLFVTGCIFASASLFAHEEQEASIDEPQQNQAKLNASSETAPAVTATQPPLEEEEMD